MKGQQEAVVWTARKVCERRFPFEKDISYYRDEIVLGWDLHRNSPRFKVLENKTDYRVTRAELIISEKECKRSKYADFSKNFMAEFDRAGIEKHSYYEWPTYRCSKIEKIYGILD